MAIDRRFCTAPMMDLSDRHCRYMWRQLSKHAVLYTEMVTSAALTRSKDIDRFLDYSELEQPLALQVGGYDTRELATAARLAEKWQYAELNLNVGCPSDRVQNGLIGAVLMKHPEKVQDAFRAMTDHCSLPVTIKHRIGVDDLDSYGFVRDFIGSQYHAGCRVFIVHARKAILQGLSPKENREIPPLKYETVYALKKDFPDCEIIINGGIKTIDECHEHLEHVDGVMVGREAYYNPMMLKDIDDQIYGSTGSNMTDIQLLHAMVPYVGQLARQNIPVKFILKHLLAVVQGKPGARAFRRFLSQNMHKTPQNSHLLSQALKLIQ
ncbi:tRNA dihydrouridine(20/20a) synthase DusA [Gynuella sunshinyii]|uniref:tRNA-dihydrouridine(20/20a) synthase n=1 Tax=Gynuella sunshinyii YC6258 TaxID=1445510 RepID=A0A0C5VPR2_9GAMM|nr:tRNA dihydrouridine(20/20a) synthase DusA [Gynuella sunshinyii]AJQ95408.1 tRNA-dihydrouridine synthase [Gynuella sunshinyii YC6258]